MVSLASTDLDTLERLAQVTGMGHINKRNPRGVPAHWKPQWCWSIGRTHEAYAFAVAIWPWMSIRRREQIRTAIITWHESVRAGTRREP